jgi:hypothetical protein
MRKNRRQMLTVCFAPALLGAELGVPSAQAGEPFPKEISAAWAKAGFRAGWIARGQFAEIEFGLDGAEQAGRVPSFRSGRWREGLLANRPLPDLGG